MFCYFDFYSFSTLFSHAQKEREEEKIRKEIYEATENYFLSKQDQFMVDYESTISIPRLQREGYLSKNIASSLQRMILLEFI